MKNAIKVLVGTLVLSAALTACGKKGGAKAAAAPGPAPAAQAAGVCQLNNQGQCVGGVGAYGYVGVNTWKGNIIVANSPVYLQFLTENGLCYGVQCTRVSGFFNVKIQTVSDTLPNAANFSITPRYQGYHGRSLETQADAYMNAANNGFQLVYNRYSGSAYGNGYGRPAVVPYGAPGQPVNQAAIAAQSASLQIVLTWADATQTIANVVLVYRSQQFAAGQVRADSLPYGQQYGPQHSGHAPEVAPFRGQRQEQPIQW